jgi:hypothetical protein
MTGYRLQIAGVLGEERAEDEVGVFFVNTQVTEGSEESGEVLARKETAWREEADGLLVRSNSNDGSMGFTFEKVPHLAIAEKELNALLHHLLEDKVLIIITDFKNIGVD